MIIDIWEEIKDFGTDLVKGMAQETKDTVKAGIFGEDAVGKSKKKKENDDDKNRIRPPKYLFKGNGVPFGKVSKLIGSKKVKFREPDWKHKIVIGATGYGKTTWGKKYVVNADHGCCFIDNNKGDAVDDILKALPRERLQKTVLLDHSDKHEPLGVGMFESSDDVFANDMIVNQWINFFITNFGLKDKFMTQEVASYAIKAAFGLEDGTLFDAAKLVHNQKYRKQVLKRLDKRIYKDTIEWWNRFEERSKNKRQQITEAFLRRASIIFRNLFLKVTLGQRTRLNYKKWMDQGYTVLIKAPETKLDTLSMRIIVALHVLSFWQAALKREGNNRQFTVITDEPQNFLSKNTDALDDIFSKARKYNMNIMALFQSTEQIRDESPALLKIMLHNEPDIIAFSNPQLKTFSDINFDDLPKYHFAARIDGKPPFVCEALGEVQKRRDDISSFVKAQRQKFNRNYRMVENEINRKVKAWQEEVNINGQKSGLQGNSLKRKSNHGSRTGTKEYSNSSLKME